MTYVVIYMKVTVNLFGREIKVPVNIGEFILGEILFPVDFSREKYKRELCISQNISREDFHFSQVGIILLLFCTRGLLPGNNLTGEKSLPVVSCFHKARYICEIKR